MRGVSLAGEETEEFKLRPITHIRVLSVVLAAPGVLMRISALYLIEAIISLRMEKHREKEHVAPGTDSGYAAQGSLLHSHTLAGTAIICVHLPHIFTEVCAPGSLWLWVV